jgi:phosphoglycerate kinase
MLAKAEANGVKFLLPVDNQCAAEFSAEAEPVLVEGNIPEDLMGMDIGPKTIELFAAAVHGAGTIVWNGPMGVFEFDKFAVGTKAMAQALADSGAITIVGGGASLEFLEGKELPGVACLLDK